MVGRDLSDLFGASRGCAGEVALELSRGHHREGPRLSLHRPRRRDRRHRRPGRRRPHRARRAVFGIDRRLGGEIRVFGRTLPLSAPADAILAGIGLAPEDRKQEALLLLRSVRDNVSLCVPEKVSRLGFFDRAPGAGCRRR